MPKGKTIRQIADEIGVTRQAVYQKIKSNKSVVKRLQLYTFTVDSTKYYTSDGEKLIKSLFSDKQAVNKGVNVSTDSVYTPVNSFTPCKQEKKSDKYSIFWQYCKRSCKQRCKRGCKQVYSQLYRPVYSSVDRKRQTTCRKG